jgi:Histidine kinase-, DNA gyrase B-, and HSP90-like ATPase
MIESMRAFGYSLSAAIADLVDNSITAGARDIRIDFHWAGDRSRVTVLDDGHGMDGPELSNAMRLGSRSPREERAPNDLGRFGLGLKTASFSQARSLTVASRTSKSAVEIRRWDLDFVTAEARWALLLDPVPGSEQFLESLDRLPSGTLVLLERLDRLAGRLAEDEGDRDRFLEHIRRVEEHLGMVFHRFLAGRGGLNIHVNGNAVQPWDPYLSAHAATQRLAPETLAFQGGSVQVQPWVLPYFTKVKGETHRTAQGPKGWNAHQGFYVYRANRLLVAGDYLGLPFRQEEHYKLARIQVDLDNFMDLAWQIDVRKATARIPGALREDMLRIAQRTRQAASDAYRFRGKTIARKSRGALAFAWRRRELRDGAIAYVVNRDHPLIRDALVEAGPARPAFERVLKLVEESVPTTAISMDASEDPEHAHARIPFHGRTQEVSDMLRLLHGRLVEGGAPADAALRVLAGTEPFDSHPEVVAALAEEIAR